MKTPLIFSFLTNNGPYKEFNSFLQKLKSNTELNFDFLKIKLEEISSQFIPIKAINDFTDEQQFFQLRTGIIQNNIKNQELRVPLIKHKIMIFQNLRQLETRMDFLRKFLIIECKDQLDNIGLKTVTEKNAVLDIFLKEGLLFVDELKILEETINLMLSNIDENKWVAKSVVDLINVSLKHPYV